MAGHYHLNLHFNYKMNLVSHTYCLFATNFFKNESYNLAYFWIFKLFKINHQNYDLSPAFIS